MTIKDSNDAWALVTKYVQDPGLRRHMRAVATAMCFYAGKLGYDPNYWYEIGLIHDFDWEIHPTMEEHPSAGAPLLRERNVPEEIIRAVLSHAEESGIKRESLMEKALFACDEITGLITATALVRPSRSIYDLETRSVKKKWKDRSFAAGANREEIEQGAIEFDIDLWEHVGNVILAMRRIAPQLGLAGVDSSPEE